MRAFLREPSTPWIVFDREGRPPSQLAVGEVLNVPRKMLLSDPAFFPATAAIDAAAAARSRAEPSSLAVASDLNDDEDVHTSAGPLALHGEAGEGAIPMGRLSRSVIGTSLGAFALVAMLGVGALQVHNAATNGASAWRNAASGATAFRTFGAPVPADIPPPDLETTASTPAPAAVPVPESPAQATAKKYGRLSVAGEARSRDVFMDGKRMLGRGARSWTILCGTHTIAVGNRADVREVEVPCTGSAELVITK